MLIRLLIVAVLAQAAFAYQASPSVSVSPTEGEVGDKLAATGADWQSGSVELFLDSVGGKPLGSSSVDRSGGFSIGFTIPTGTSLGRHRAIACLDRNTSNDCRESASGSFTVIEPTTTTTTTSTTTTSTTSTSTTSTTSTSTTTTTLPPSTTTTTTAPTTTVGVSITTTTGAFAAPSSSTTTSTTAAVVGIVTTASTQATPGAVAAPDALEWPDIEIVGFEVTQGIQDLQNRMPLVADRKTWVRLYVAADKLPDSDGESDLAIENVGSQWSYEGWDPVDGALLLQRGGSNLVVYPENAPITAFGDSGDRLDADSTLNFIIPDGWDDPGQMTISGFVWSFQPTTPETMEPDAANNFADVGVEFWEAIEPTAITVRLENDPVWSATSLANYANAVDLVEESLLTFHPISGASLVQALYTIGPGEEVTEEEDPDGNWNLNDRGWEPNTRMGWYHALWDLPEEEWFVGVAPSNASSKWSGWANPGNHAFWTKGNETTPGHEMGHSQGLAHVACKDTNDPIGVPDELVGGAIDPTHATAFPNCSLGPVDPDGYFGFTTLEATPTVYSNDPNISGARFPFMSYRNPEWTDPYHTCLLLESYGVPCDPTAIGAPPVFQVVDFGQSDDLIVRSHQDASTHDGWIELISISGGIHEPQIQTGILLTDPTLGARRLLDSQLKYSTALLEDFDDDGAVDGFDFLVWRGTTASGEPTFELPVALDSGGHGGGGDVTGEGNLAALPWPEGTTTIQLVRPDGTIADQRSLSAAPEIELGPVEIAGRGVSLSWSGSDPDGDELLYSVSATADGGETWRAIEVLTPNTSLVITDDVALAGGDQVGLRITATDGMTTSTADTPLFSISDAAPWIAINSSISEVGRYAPVEISASAYDPEDRTLRDIAWSSNLDGDLGVGREISTRWLSLGNHILTAQVTDSVGNLSVDTHVLEVIDSRFDEPRTEGAAPDVEFLLRSGPDGFSEIETELDTPAQTDSVVEAAEEPQSDDPVSLAGPILGGVALLGLATGLLMWRRRSDKHPVD